MADPQQSELEVTMVRGWRVPCLVLPAAECAGGPPQC